jgi:hypothetical protein
MKQNPRMSIILTERKKALLSKIKVSISNDKSIPSDLNPKGRKSVMDTVNIYESKLKKESTNMVNQIYNSSKIEINEKIRKLLEQYNRDPSILNLADEFMKDKLKGIGIQEKDFRELVELYNKAGAAKTTTHKGRNTVHGLMKNNRLNAPPLKDNDEMNSSHSGDSIDSNHDLQPELVEEVEKYESEHNIDNLQTNEKKKTLLRNIQHIDDSQVNKKDTDYICFNDSNNFKRKERISNNGKCEINPENQIINQGSNKQVYDYNRSHNEINPTEKAKKAARAILKEINIENSINNTSTDNNTGISSPTALNVYANINTSTNSGRKSIAQRKSNSRENKLKEFIDSKNNLLNGKNSFQDEDISGNKSAHTEQKHLNYEKEKKRYSKTLSQEQGKYQKNIIQSLDSIAIMHYSINTNLPLDPMFFDILCINCYECVKPTEVDNHSQFCVIHPDDYNHLNIKNESEEDYNARIYKLHESLKKKKFEITNQEDVQLAQVYNELLRNVYEILMNNHVIRN